MSASEIDTIRQRAEAHRVLARGGTRFAQAALTYVTDVDSLFTALAVRDRQLEEAAEVVGDLIAVLRGVMRGVRMGHARLALISESVDRADVWLARREGETNP